MSAKKTPAKAKAAAPDKKVPVTGELPLAGGKDGKTVGLDNKTTIREPIPAEVQSAANHFAVAKHRLDVYTNDAKEKGLKLLDLMLKHSLGSKTRVKVEVEGKTRFIRIDDTVTLKVESAAPKRGEKQEKKEAVAA